MEILLKRSQISIDQIEGALSKSFLMERHARGRHEWIEGELKEIEGLGRARDREEARVSLSVPYADRERRNLIVRLLSPFSGALYCVRLSNLDLASLLAVVREFQILGVDIGFAEATSQMPGHHGSSPLEGGGRYRWPEGKDNQISTATELHGLYEQGRT
jgi:hypothetical protein